MLIFQKKISIEVIENKLGFNIDAGILIHVFEGTN